LERSLVTGDLSNLARLQRGADRKPKASIVAPKAMIPTMRLRSDTLSDDMAASSLVAVIRIGSAREL
jgi:hypothetical protein